MKTQSIDLVYQMIQLLKGAKKPMTICDMYTKVTHKNISNLGGRGYKNIRKLLSKYPNIVQISKGLKQHTFSYICNIQSEVAYENNVSALDNLSVKYKISKQSLTGVLYFTTTFKEITFRTMQKDINITFDEFFDLSNDIQKNSNNITNELHTAGIFRKINGVLTYED